MATDKRALQKKLDLFEYIVAQLFKWAESENIENLSLSKLRLQKILFLLCTISATEKEYPLLEIFNSFYALPYGPVETDIYNAMLNDSFSKIKFNGNDCSINNYSLEDSDLDEQIRQAINTSIDKMKNLSINYLKIPVFDLVQITHRWTVWQVAMSIAEMFGGKSEKITTEEILNSQVKVFN